MLAEKQEHGLTTSSSEAETVITTDEEYPLPKRMKGTKMKTVMNNKLAVSLDMAKLSDRGAALVLTSALQSLGHEPTNVVCSYSSIRRERIKRREDIARNIKEGFNHDDLLTVHWDGKLLEDLTGHETVDRLPIIITGKETNQLLGIPKLSSGTGEATAEAVYNAC